MNECDKGEDMNPMEYVSNNGDFFFYTCGVILQSEEYRSDEIPKCLTRMKCVFTWKPKHSWAAIDLVCFNLFMFLSPKG
jgi:hypothetical protein